MVNETIDAGVVTRQRRPAEEKRRIVEATMVPGASIARVARGHGANANQVFQWRPPGQPPTRTPALESRRSFTNPTRKSLSVHQDKSRGHLNLTDVHGIFSAREPEADHMSSPGSHGRTKRISSPGFAELEVLVQRLGGTICSTIPVERISLTL